jgi:hypothetical protein
MKALLGFVLAAALCVGTASARSSSYHYHAPKSYSSAVHVRGYTRKDGTYVMPHMRSAPDHNVWNNWSTKGNVNPYTGREGTKNPDPIYTPGYVPPDAKPEGSGGL